jgi:hypothetical protein
LDSGIGVEDRGGVVADEVGRNALFSGVLKDSLVFTLGSLLDDSLDLLVCGRLLEADNEIDNGDIESGDTEGGAAVDERFG